MYCVKRRFGRYIPLKFLWNKNCKIKGNLKYKWKKWICQHKSSSIVSAWSQSRLWNLHGAKTLTTFTCFLWPGYSCVHKQKCSCFFSPCPIACPSPFPSLFYLFFYFPFSLPLLFLLFSFYTSESPTYLQTQLLK